MIKEFEHLSDQERELLYDAIPYITVLIAGADGKIDDRELEWAEKVTQIRTYTYEDHLKDYYTQIGNHYSDKLDQLLAEYKQNPDALATRITSQLEKLNDIMPKIDYIFARHLYKSWVTFARHVAVATGGFLGFNSVRKSERELMSLPMINEI